MCRRIALSLALLLLLSVLPFSVFAEETGVNLAEGLKYTVETGEPVEYSHGNFTENGVEFDVDEGQLTDGKFATASPDASGWYRAFRGKSRIVTFDLGAVCAVSGVRASFLNYKQAGIYAPRYINVYLSENGIDYGLVIEKETGFALYDTEPKHLEASVDIDRLYAARYVKVEFCSDIFAYCDEIQIFGLKILSGNEKAVEPDQAEEPAGFLSSLAGVSDMIKIYNGYYAPDQERADNTEEELLPYIAYLNEKGEIEGTMFDSVAFVPCHGDYPSGGRLTKTNGKPGALMSDWELYFRHTFTENKDIDALNKVVGTVYSKLGIDKKLKVFLTLPYPTVTEKPFGDIDKDAFAEDCKTLEERVAIVKWFADKCIKQFAANNYENLELAGFYWLREEINYSDSDHEAQLVLQVNEYIESKKLVTLFDAFYLSIGYDHWEELGFSGAVMQPNVAFRDTYTYFELPMLGEFAQTAEKNHIGVEVETDEPSFFQGDQYAEAGFNYESYLYYGYKSGYMNALKTFYQGAGPGSIYDFCHADTSTPKGVYLRRLYDITHEFLMGTYKNLAPTVEVTDIEMVSGDKRAMVDMVITDTDSYWGDISVKFPQAPAHGKVTSSAGKKTLIYSPDKDFVGEDSFTVVVSDGFNKTEELTVKVTVAPAEEISGNETSAGDSSSAPGQTKGEGETPLWLIALIAALGAAIVAVAAIMIVKRIKKN